MLAGYNQNINKGAVAQEQPNAFKNICNNYATSSTIPHKIFVIIEVDKNNLKFNTSWIHE
jgi:hypothetical protein